MNLTFGNAWDTHVEPIRDRVNELEELTASNRKTIRDVDGRAQQGIQLVSAKADIGDQHALEATNKAQMANTLATSAQTRVSAVETVVNILKIDVFNLIAEPA
jgi:hypothetical protein